MAKLSLTRPSEFMNRFRDYQIYIDGKQVGEIENNQTKTIELEPGHHVLHTVIDWCASPKIEFEVKDNEEVAFRVEAFKQFKSLRKLWIPLIILYALTFFIDFPDYINIAITISALFILGFLVYYMSFGRKKYLQLHQLS